VGNPHAGFDVAGDGNGLLGTAPFLDPTLGGLGLATAPGYPVLGFIPLVLRISFPFYMICFPYHRFPVLPKMSG
jgi:hypothetical protein